nr:vegetative incompatibility protein het-e-1 [Quercus suber]
MDAARAARAERGHLPVARLGSHRIQRTQRLRSKRDTMQTGISLESRVSAITQIPEAILQDYGKSEGLSSDEKRRWMTGRDTTRGEDQSYCLLGILGVSMNIRYGDGRERTRIRLLEKVSKSKKLIPGIKQDKYRIQFSRRGIPFTNFFVPREVDMQHLKSFFQSAMAAQRQRVFVMHGMGGMGKTQLCAEFARRQQEQFSAVFWLDGSSRAALKRSLVSAASRLPVNASQQSAKGLSASVDSAQLSESFLQWLSLPDNKDWLLIIDNVDRDWRSRMEDPQAYDYGEFLPHADHGSILVTTRLARLRRPNTSLALASVDDGVAREMVKSRAGRQIPGERTTPVPRYSEDPH